MYLVSDTVVGAMLKENSSDVNQPALRCQNERSFGELE
jgi:hypothetical protein